jgi:SAM-dependent methyltransferase
MKDLASYNSNAWDNEVDKKNKWTVPVDGETIVKAKQGDWSIVLTPLKPVPSDWFIAPPCKILCLASGGGQQGPILAAAGYDVTVFDNSQKQLEQDIYAAKENDLKIETLSGVMEDLSQIADRSFDMVFNPCSIIFTKEPLKVFEEVFRVLKPGGVFMTGFSNPVNWLFDYQKSKKGEFVLRYSQPYSDIESLDKKDLDELVEGNEPLLFAHSLDVLIGGQVRTGFIIKDMFEDYGDDSDELRKYYPGFIATRAVKPK